MSKMRCDRKPPLARSPTRLRPRRVLRSYNPITTSPLQTPPGSLAKSMKPTRASDTDELGLRPEYRSISCELHALAKMVHDEFGNEGLRSVGAGNVEGLSANPTALFERGRFYEEYSTRRNERLKRKKGGAAENVEGKIMATPYNLGVTVEASKRRDAKKLASLRKSVSAAYSVERSENPRYMLRSLSKENKKPPLAVNGSNLERSMLASERKIGTRSVRKKSMC